MLYRIDKSRGNAYLQLYNLVRENIINGAYGYGTKLPSKRTIALETGVSVITVQHAYEILCDEGYVEARERSGYFVIYKDKDFFSVGKNTSRTLGSIHLPDLGEFPFSILAKTMRKVLSNYEETILIKSPSCGCLELRQALAGYLLRSRGVSVAPNQIVIGSGAEYLYGLVVQLLGRDKLVALEKPSYETIRKVYEANGASIEMLQMGSDGIESSVLKESKAEVLHVTPYNSYPTGITASASKRREYVRWAIDRCGYIVEDDYASEFTVSTKMEDTLYSLDPNGRVIYINTFSKTIAPSVRVGYMVLPMELVDTFQEKLGFYSCTVPVFEQYVLTEFINDGDFERHINKMRRKLRKARED